MNLLPPILARLIRSLAGAALALLGTAVSHAATTVQLGSASAGPGEAAQIDVAFQSDTVAAAFQVDVRYDATRLAPGIAEGTTHIPGHLVSGGSPSPGLYRLVVYSLSNRPLPNGVVARLAFRPQAGAAAATLPLAVSNLVVATPAASRVAGATASPGSVTVRTAGAPRFLLPTISANGTATLRLNGVAGRTYALQYSTDLSRWTALSTATAGASDGSVTFTDTPVPAARFRFYRALESP